MEMDENKSPKIDKKELSKNFARIKEFFLNKKVQIILTVLVFLIILILSSAFRFSNLNLLKDSTTGDYTAADPDALYFLRLTHVVFEQGNLNGIDEMRAPGANISYLKEITPYTIVLIYKAVNIFSDKATLNYVAAISPVIFFILGMIAFFFLCYYLTKSKLIALLSSLLLAFSPAYLFRTTSGVFDHDAIGMLGIFSTLLVFAIGMNHFKTGWKKTIIWSAILGLTTAFSLGAWAGGVTFLFMIIPSAILVYYLFNMENSIKEKEKLIVFNLLWIAFYILFSSLIGFKTNDVLNRLLNPSSLLVALGLGFILVDYALEKNMKKIKFINEKNKTIYSIILIALIGILFLVISGKNVFSMIYDVYAKLLSPFGYGGRLGSTVSENAQPYLNTWISQTGKAIFWLFIGGMFFIGLSFSKKISLKKDSIYFMLFWVLAISGILFSRVSADSLFNGENFISQLFYIGSLLIFIGYLFWMYFKKRFTIDPEAIIMFSWMIFMLLMGRAASRTIFVATPFVCFSASFFTIKLTEYAKKSKDEIMKIILIIGSVVVILIVILSIVGSPLSKTAGLYQTTKYQAQYIGATANYQWQNAMAWARSNTDESSIFVHWWDYGYLVQTVGERKSVSDGGHAAGDSGDHNVGRYVLTTPNPETAFSYMKTWNVSYLLIDPTDYGKYGAYSLIGSDENYDRYSSPGIMLKDSSQTSETSSGMTIVYQGGTFVDEDINYDNIFLPGPSFDRRGNPKYNSYVLGIISELTSSNQEKMIKQPEAVFLYNDKQYKMPIRYIFYNGKIVDFGSGINSTFMIIPHVTTDSSGGAQVDNFGAGLYLSPKVSESLFARLYLMNDPFNEYSTIKKADFEDDYVVALLKQQGYITGEFVYYQGLRGPLKVWEVNYPANTETHEEFLQIVSNWEGELDRLFE